jgi:hypothetical protein
MIEINLTQVKKEAIKEIFYQHLAELIYKVQLEPLGW